MLFRARIFFGLLLLLVSCSDGIKKSDHNINFNELSDDALLNIARKGISLQDLRAFKIVMLKRCEVRSSQPMVEEVLYHLKRKNKSPYVQWVCSNIAINLLLEKGELDSSLYLARSSLKFIGTHDSIATSDIYHDLGYVFYHRQNVRDSVLKYWKIAYQLTEEQSDLKRLTVTSFNLATYYQSLGLYDASRKLYRRCIRVMEILGKKSPLLMNNIISLLLSRDKIQEAYQYWEKNKEDLKGDTESYLGQVIMLNRIVLLEQLDRFGESDSILRRMNGVEIKNILFKDYTQALMVSAVNNRSDTFLDRRFEGCVVQYAPMLLADKGAQFIEFLDKPMWRFIKDSLRIQYESCRLNKCYEERILYAMAKYLATQNEYPLIAQLRFHKEALVYREYMDLFENKLDRQVVEELDDYEKVIYENRVNQALLKESKTREYGYLIILVLLVTIGIISVFAIKQIYNTTRERSLWLENANKQKEELLLTNERLLEYSKVVISRNEEIKRRLLSLDLSGRSDVNGRIKLIIKELDILSRINTNEKPQIADKLISDSAEHPNFSKLTKAEKRVFVLLKNHYRPKDIANMLGYSAQYVRNIKSRIGKKLELTDIENWE